MIMGHDNGADPHDGVGKGIAPRPRIGGRLSLRSANRILSGEGCPRDLPAGRTDPR